MGSERYVRVLGAVATGLAVLLLPSSGVPSSGVAATVATSPATGLDPRCAAIADGHPPPATDRLPVAIGLVEAVWCERTERPPGPAGLGSIVERRTRTGLGPLTEAFRRRTSGIPGCTAPPQADSWLWVLTADGRWYRPEWPYGGCGDEWFLRLLRSLPFTEVARAPVTRPIPDRSRAHLP
jgi:hypothetical protein